MLGCANWESETAAAPGPAPLGLGSPSHLPGCGQSFQHVLDRTRQGPLAPRRSEFRHDLVALRHQYRLARLGQSDVFRESRLELLDPNDLHRVMVVTGDYHVNAFDVGPGSSARQ